MKKRPYHFPARPLPSCLLLLGLLLFSGCGGSDDSGVNNPPPPPAGTTVGPNGGTVTSSDGNATVDIPAGALVEDEIFKLEPKILNPPVTGLISDRSYSLKGSTAGFLQSVEISIAYDPGEIPSGVSESEMAIYLLENDTTTEVPGCTVDTDAHTVTGSVLGPPDMDFSRLSYKDDLIDMAGLGIGKIRRSGLQPGTTTYFTMTSVLTSNSCFSVPTYPLSTQHITISEDGQQMTFMGITGPWTGASGEGTKQQTIPIFNDCSVAQTLRVVVVFADPSHFTGTFSVTGNYSNGCTDVEDCEYEFGLSGVRVE